MARAAKRPRSFGPRGGGPPLYTPVPRRYCATSREASIPPIRGGMLAAPLTGRDGNNLGVIYLSDRTEGVFFTGDLLRVGVLVRGSDERRGFEDFGGRRLLL